MFEKVRFPELVIGIAGPIGVDIDAITLSIEDALREVRYDSSVIKLTTEMRNYHVDLEAVDEEDFHKMMHHKMDYADALCINYSDPAVLSRIAINSIRKIRVSCDIPEKRRAYIIRQFKRPEEITLLRTVYGKQFILVSAYGSVEDRKQIIETRLKRSTSTLLDGSDYSTLAEKLIERDASEPIKFGGQQLRDTFHLADVFIDGIIKDAMDSKLKRFMRSLFGLNTAAPTKDEYGMYAAKSASLRSCDLSRQVGAAVFSQDGELITQGCNEVPKAFGGTYWDLETPDYRDVQIGHDPNEDLKRELLRNLFEKLWEKGFLSDDAIKHGSPARLLKALTTKAQSSDEEDGALVGSAVMDLTEYGRVVHAEMCAICDAARLGKSIKNSTLYCTTFPCHNCTKHILASGIRRVVYMEPYPKSKAKELHKNEIDIERESSDKVSFVPFIGISPFRYRDIFQKGKRKNNDGIARTWYATENHEEPMVDVFFDIHPDLEVAALKELVGTFQAINSTD